MLIDRMNPLVARFTNDECIRIVELALGNRVFSSDGEPDLVERAMEIAEAVAAVRLSVFSVAQNEQPADLGE